MTRKEGIIKQWEQTHKKQINAAEHVKLLNFEYQNYAELCEFCHEKPKTKSAWLSEAIIPAAFELRTINANFKP